MTIAGALNNSGTVNISDDNTTSPTTATAVSLNNTGTLNLSGSRGGKATLDLTGGAAPSVLASTITLAGNSLLEFANGEINSIAAGGKLVVNGTSFVADASDPTHNSALTALTTVAGEFDLGNGAWVALGGALAVTGTLNVDGFYNTFGSTLTVGGDLSNSGTVNIGGGNNAGASTVTIAGALNNSGTVNISDDNTSLPTVLTAATLNNTGTLNLGGSRSGVATLDITSAAPSVLAATVTLAGNSLLEFASGSIGSIAAGAKLVLGSSTTQIADASDLTHNSALSGLQSVAGTLSLQGGSAVGTAGALAVSGSLSLQGSTLTTGGAVTVTGSSASVNIDASSTLTVGGTSFTQTGGTTTVSGALSAPLIDVAGGKLDEAKSVTGLTTTTTAC